MIELDIPGRGRYTFKYLVLDMNGTITLDGELIEGVAERLQALGNSLNITVITADTHGGADKLAEILKIEVHKLHPGEGGSQKLTFIKKLGAENTIAIGNGSNDALMLKESALGICIVGREGASAEAGQNSDILITDICDALDLLLKPKRLLATLRR